MTDREKCCNIIMIGVGYMTFEIVSSDLREISLIVLTCQCHLQEK